MKRIVIPLLLLCSVAAAAPAADKKAKDEARRLFDVGSDAYQNRFYDEALQAFEEAFRISEKPELQFNIGLCLEHMGKEREAAAAYRRYLALGATRDREEVGRRAAALEALLAARNKPPETPLAIAPGPLQPVAPVGESERARALRRGVIGAAAATGAITLVAVGLTIGAAAGYHDLVESCPSGAGCTADARDGQLQLDRASDVMWGIAAAGAITTVALQLVLRHERKQLRARVPSGTAVAFSF